MEQAIDFALPLALQSGDFGGILRADFLIGQRRGKLFERHARIGNNWNGADLISVELRRVDVDEAHIRILKRGHRSRSEVRIASADADHQVSRSAPADWPPAYP